MATKTIITKITVISVAAKQMTCANITKTTNAKVSYFVLVLAVVVVVASKSITWKIVRICKRLQKKIKKPIATTKKR